MGKRGKNMQNWQNGQKSLFEGQERFPRCPNGCMGVVWISKSGLGILIWYPQNGKNGPFWVQERIEAQEGSMRKKNCVASEKKFRYGLKRKTTVLKRTTCAELNSDAPRMNELHFTAIKCPYLRDQIEGGREIEADGTAPPNREASFPTFLHYPSSHQHRFLYYLESPLTLKTSMLWMKGGLCGGVLAFWLSSKDQIDENGKTPKKSESFLCFHFNEKVKVFFAFTFWYRFLQLGGYQWKKDTLLLCELAFI